MWKFANPIKHKIPETRWPTAEEAARSRLFSPIAIGRLEARSRTGSAIRALLRLAPKTARRVNTDGGDTDEQ